MCNENFIECPMDFHECKAHLDYSAHMQHYGLPIRLVDITTNPMAVLYFACESNPKKQGEIIVFDVEHSDIKYPGTDSITKAIRLLHEIRLKKPAFH